jgi:medium-chain acyl-[acyl-carrier-protein] hydrolase
MTAVPASTVSPWVVRPRPNAGAALRLFCFPHAGGGASAYRSWVFGAPASLEVCGVQLPGRESRWKEPRFRAVTEIVPQLVQGLSPWLDRPFAFFGHSLGALLAFETATALGVAGMRIPAHVFVSAHRAPHRHNPHAPMRHLGDEAFILEMRQRYGGVPQAVLDSPELLALMLPCLRDDFTMFETYEHRMPAPLSVPVTALGGTADRFVTADELADWKRHTTGGFAVHQLPGDHFYLQDGRDAVIAIITAALAGSPAVSTGSHP